MMRKTNTLLITMLMFICLLAANAKAEEINTLTCSNIKYALKYDDNSFALLCDKTVYILEDTGIVEKEISLDEFLLSDEDLELSIEVIKDIDNDGKNDLLIVAKNSLLNNKVFTISGEDGNLIWNKTTVMNSSDYCDNQKFCSRNVRVVDYFLNGDELLIGYGYNLDKVDLKNGVVLSTFQNENNIFSLIEISDLNNDGHNEIALSSQPATVKLIDGKNFTQSSEIEVSIDIELEAGLKVKRNVWDLNYNESKNILLSASEDGNVYEIDLNSAPYQVKNKTVYGSDTFLIKDYYCGVYDESVYKSLFYKNIEIISSNDNSYLVKYRATTDEKKINDYKYKMCSLNGSCETIILNNQIKKFESNYIVYQNQTSGNTIVQDIFTDEIVFEQNIYVTDILIVDNSIFIVNDDEVIIYKDDIKLSEFKLINKKDYQVIDDYIITFNYGGNGFINSFQVKSDDSNFNFLIPEDAYLFDYKLIDDILYIIEKDYYTGNYILQIWELNKNQLVNEKQIDDYSGDIKISNDLNDDNIAEFVLIENNKIAIIDLKNDITIENEVVLGEGEQVDSLYYDTGRNIVLVAYNPTHKQYSIYNLNEDLTVKAKLDILEDKAIREIAFIGQSNLNDDAVSEFVFSINHECLFILENEDNESNVYEINMSIKNVLPITDLDNDHKQDIIVVVEENNQIKIKVINFSNDVFVKDTIDISSYFPSHYNLEYNGSYVDIDNDSVEELIFITYDSFDNLDMLVLDFNSNEKFIIYGLNNDELNITSKMKIAKVKNYVINDKIYFEILSEDSSKSYFISYDDLRVISSSTEKVVGVINDKILLQKGNDYHLVTLMNDDLLILNKNNEVLSFTFKGENRVKIMIDYSESFDYFSEEVSLYLSNGKHYIHLEITTTDGMTYYHDFKVNVETNKLVYIEVFGCLLVALGFVFTFSRLVKNYFYKSK